MGNVVGRAFVPMGRIKFTVRNVTGIEFVAMGSRKIIARIVMVEGCARLHIVQPEKTVSTKDTVFFALSICFLPGAWQRIIGRRSPL